MSAEGDLAAAIALGLDFAETLLSDVRAAAQVALDQEFTAADRLSADELAAYDAGVMVGASGALVSLRKRGLL